MITNTISWSLGARSARKQNPNKTPARNRISIQLPSRPRPSDPSPQPSQVNCVLRSSFYISSPLNPPARRQSAPCLDLPRLTKIFRSIGVFFSSPLDRCDSQHFRRNPLISSLFFAIQHSVVWHSNSSLQLPEWKHFLTLASHFQSKTPVISTISNNFHCLHFLRF
jgi:hypothetical protein